MAAGGFDQDGVATVQRQRAASVCGSPAIPFTSRRRLGLRSRCSLAARAGSRGTVGWTKGPSGASAGAFPGQGQSVIYLFMHGGPSHLETFDPKPDLQRLWPASRCRQASGRSPPVARSRITRCSPPARTFRKCGQSGIEISDFLPHLADCADDLAVIRSCWADSVNHPQAVYQMNTGSILMGKPSLGSWVSYGLGTENQDLPAFVVLPDPAGGIKGGPPAYGAGFLPASHQGTVIRGGDRARSSTCSRPRRCRARAAARRARPDRPARTPIISRNGATTPSSSRTHPGVRAGFPHAERRP